MAIVREGNQGVLVVVDVQVDVVSEAWETQRIVANVAGAVSRARAQGVSVIWVQHSGDDLAFNSPGWQWVPELGFCRNSAKRPSIAARPRPIRRPASRTGSRQTWLCL